ncbi:SDR family oxidoreductase [Streptomyces sp. GbtcB6]|uniref:SDR family oxidoreductase n=1 Tax=Streptomyces sp. GbtcB6 TaxID=2824751 RepID=UPI001C2FB81C|nr:SDR family oxidoreductase [Streptomyces sp. GbtcB6]
MRVFVTGGSGFIGSAVVPELLGAGHRVLALARSDKSAETLRAAGAEVHRGSLDDPEDLARAAAGTDGVIHLAFNHDDFLNMTRAVETDLGVIEAIGAALAGSDRPFVATSGTLLLAAIDGVATEDDTPAPGIHRGDCDRAALALAARGVRSSVVRLAPTVHGRGDQGFVPRLIGIAREKGVAAYVGDGTNRWPAAHRLDAARLYRRALESAPAGTALHGAADEGVPFKDIAAAMGRGLDVPVKSIPADEAQAHFGWLGMAASIDNATSSERTRKLLGWKPEQPGLIADLEEGHYF